MEVISSNFFISAIWQKKRCWACGSLVVIRWGKRGGGKQRFKCKQCGILFTENRKEQRLKNRFVWFRKWILERQTYRTLCRESGYSKDTLQKTFYAFLEQAPRVKIIKCDKVHLRMDGTYFDRFCLVAYQNDENGYTQLIRFTDKERFEEIKQDLDNLIRLGVQLESITTDGHKSVLKAIRKSAAAPQVVVQRCLVHIQRMCLMWLTKYPKHTAAKELRAIVLLLLKIRTDNDKLYWINQLQAWHQNHKAYLSERTKNEQTGRYWYTHKLLCAGLII